MKTALTRVIGIILIATAFFGLLFSVYAIVQIWRLKPGIEESLAAELELLDETITTTSRALTIMENTLDQAAGDVDSLEEATQTLAQSLHDSAPMVESLIDLVGNDLPETITATQTSLASAQTSARLVDSMLETISRIPFLGLGSYQPEVPLNVALEQVSRSLDNLPESLQTIHASLETASQNLGVMEVQVENIGNDIREINEDLGEARQVIVEYQGTAGELQGQLGRVQARLPVWTRQVAWLATFLLVWLGIMQIGLFSQGLEMVGRRGGLRE